MTWIYKKTDDNKARFVLGEPGENSLVCIGVNPSTATPDRLDNTLRTVKKLSVQHGFDGWIMLNLYPQRATNPNDMHEERNTSLHLENLRNAQDVFTFGHTTIWAAWGAIVEKRRYLPGCVQAIAELAARYNADWKTIGARSKAGHPHHPLYLNHSLPLEPFDIDGYLRLIGKSGIAG